MMKNKCRPGDIKPRSIAEKTVKISRDLRNEVFFHESEVMSTILIQCTNKTLTIIYSPSIDIGGVNSLQFSFCPLWDGYEKGVQFYKNETDYYSVDIVKE